MQMVDHWRSAMEKNLWGCDVIDYLLESSGRILWITEHMNIYVTCDFWFQLAFILAGEDAMTGDTDKYLGPQDLKELGDDSLPAEGYMGFSLGARSARYCIRCF